MTSRLAVLALVVLVSSSLAAARPHVLPEDVPLIGATALARQLSDPDQVVVEVRRDEEFNGWRLSNEPRGGHIPGAVQLSPDLVEGAALPSHVRRSLERSGVDRARRLVIAANDPAHAAYAVHAMRRAGYPRLAVLEGGIGAWLADSNLPLERLPGYRTLVPPAWVDAVRLGKPVPDGPEGPVTLLEVGWGGPESAYNKGHIPGAVHLDTNLIEADTKVQPRGFWRLLPPARLQAALEKLGITRNSTVILYSDPNFAAARAGWAMIYAGVRDVRILNGGLRAWKRARLPVETLPAVAPRARAFGGAVPLRPGVRRETAWVHAHLLDPAHSLADIRSWKEFTGEITGYDDVTGKGRIPGARWARGGKNPHSLTGDYEDEDGTFRAYPEVDAMWRQWGMPPDRPMTFYCGTGWRAAQGWLYAHMLERPSPAVYDSGWMDWCMGPNARANPIALGKP